MKKVFKHAMLAVAAIAAAGFASCSKDENAGGMNPGESQKAYLNIVLDNPSMTQTRAAGEAPATDNTVQNFSVFVLDEDGNANWKTHVTSGNVLEDFEVTTLAKRVYVIANADDQTGNYSSREELEAAKIDLSSQLTSRWATGNTATDLVFTPDAGNSNIQTATVNPLTLQFVASRITVKVVNNMNGYDFTDANPDPTVVINNVTLLNARAQSELFPGVDTRLIPAYDANKQWLEGMANPGTPFIHYPAAGTFTVDGTNMVAAYSPAADKSWAGAHFFVYENDALTAATFPTIVSLTGTDVEGNPVYFPVHLAPYETWGAGSIVTQPFTADGGLLRGKSYDITITLNGDATAGNGGGTHDPTENVVNALVNVTLVITDWVPVTLNKEF